MTESRVLIACIGNIFLGDDAFGVEVARQLASRPLPEEAKVVDYGIRGLDLAYALLDGYDLTIIVDAAPRGGQPGDLYVIEPRFDDIDQTAAEHASEQTVIDTHGMNPMRVLGMVRSMGCQLPRLLVVGCEPATLGPEEGQMGLSDPVAASVPDAASLVESLVTKFLNGQQLDWEPI
jgi:hydrogenase maturation protease